MTNSIPIYNYTDYPSYLKDLVSHKKSNGHGFSYRNFSLKAGISTENYLKLVINRKKKLGLKLCEQFIQALSLKKSEADYFRALVGLELASSLGTKQHYLEKMEELQRRFGSNGKKEVISRSIHRQWYWPIVWELSSCKDFNLTPENVVRVLNEKITHGQARKAIETLVSQGFLVREKRGAWAQAPLKISSSNGIEDIYLQANHRKMSLAAADAIDLPLSDRAFQGLTIAIDPSRVEEVKQELHAMVRSLQEKFGNDPNAKTVYRFNLQCFPVTKK